MKQKRHTSTWYCILCIVYSTLYTVYYVYCTLLYILYTVLDDAYYTVRATTFAGGSCVSPLGRLSSSIIYKY